MKLRSASLPHLVFINGVARFHNVVNASSVKEFLKIRVLLPAAFVFINYFLKFTAKINNKFCAFQAFINRTSESIIKGLSNLFQPLDTSIKKAMALFKFLFSANLARYKATHCFFILYFFFSFPFFQSELLSLEPVVKLNCTIAESKIESNRYSAESTSYDNVTGNGVDEPSDKRVKYIDTAIHSIVAFFFWFGFGFILSVLIFPFSAVLQSFLQYIFKRTKSIIAKIKGVKK